MPRAGLWFIESTVRAENAPTTVASTTSANKKLAMDVTLVAANLYKTNPTP